MSANVMFVCFDVTNKVPTAQVASFVEINTIINMCVNILKPLMESLPGAVLLTEGPLAGEMGPEPDRDCWD